MNMAFRWWTESEIAEDGYIAVVVRIQDDEIAPDEDRIVAYGTDFEVTVHFDITDSGIAIKRISADVEQDTSGDLTSTQLRKIRIGEVRSKIQKDLNDDPTLLSPAAFIGKLIDEGQGTATDEEFEYMRAARYAVESATEHLTDRPKRGRGVDNQDWYGHVARVYLDFYAEHGQRTVRAMAEYLDAPPTTVSWWVRKAREHGWLTEGRQGRAGAGPGPRLIAWVQKQEEEE